MFQMGNVGPILGQHHQFPSFFPGKSSNIWSEERFLKESTKIICKTLDKDLSKSEFLVGDKIYNCRYCYISLDSKAQLARYTFSFL